MSTCIPLTEIKRVVCQMVDESLQKQDSRLTRWLKYHNRR